MALIQTSANSAILKFINGHRRRCPSLGDLLAAASPTERLEAAREVGVGVIWDDMISPLLEEDRASTPVEHTALAKAAE
jgi:hypothetical protein